MEDLSATRLPDCLRDYLDRSGAAYTLEVGRADVDATRKPDFDVFVHVLGAGDDYVLLLTTRLENGLPADWLARLGRAFGRPARLASEAEMRLLFPDCDPVWVPPFGPAYGLPVYASRELNQLDERVNCPAGCAGAHICMSRATLEQLAAPTWIKL